MTMEKERAFRNDPGFPRWCGPELKSSAPESQIFTGIKPSLSAGTELLQSRDVSTGIAPGRMAAYYDRLYETRLNALLQETRRLAERGHHHGIVSAHISRFVHYAEALIETARLRRSCPPLPAGNALQCQFTPDTFQVAQRHYIEIYCTRLENLICGTGTSHSATVDDQFSRLYWRAGSSSAGPAEQLKRFDDKYRADLLSLARRMKGRTLEERLMRNKGTDEIFLSRLRQFDHLFNACLPRLLQSSRTEGDFALRFFPFAWEQENGK